jgi:hypothetical protein
MRLTGISGYGEQDTVTGSNDDVDIMLGRRFVNTKLLTSFSRRSQDIISLIFSHVAPEGTIESLLVVITWRSISPTSRCRFTSGWFTGGEFHISVVLVEVDQFLQCTDFGVFESTQVDLDCRLEVGICHSVSVCQKNGLVLQVNTEYLLDVAILLI